MPSDEPSRPYASPACLLGEIDPAYADPKYGLEEQQAALDQILLAAQSLVDALNRLIPRLPDGPLHAELTGVRDRQSAELARLSTLTSARDIPSDRPPHR
ncbi:MAG TPA: hypothetical protein VKQ29_15980 [Aliidongia sp.]|jgi:hypothetical protein|nr:hypothetical protein [Aliidongia sp.]